MRIRFAKIILGALAGTISYVIVSSLQNPWSGVIGALLIGLVPGIVDHSLPRAGFGALACGGGWLAGSLCFGVWMDFGIGAWVVAGAFLGAAAGLCSASISRAGIGTLLGLFAGAIGELSRFATVLVRQLRGVDMELILLLCVGGLLNGAVALLTPSVGRRSR